MIIALANCENLKGPRFADRRGGGDRGEPQSGILLGGSRIILLNEQQSLPKHQPPRRPQFHLVLIFHLKAVVEVAKM